MYTCRLGMGAPKAALPSTVLLCRSSSDAYTHLILNMVLSDIPQITTSLQGVQRVRKSLIIVAGTSSAPTPTHSRRLSTACESASIRRLARNVGVTERM
jgi:hypothetical protein